MTRVSDSTPSELEVAKPDDDDAFPVAVRVICASLPDVYVEKLLGFVAACLERSGHLQFYMMWAQNLLMLHGQNLKSRCVNTCLFSSTSVTMVTSVPSAGRQPCCPRSRPCRRASRHILTVCPNCECLVLSLLVLCAGQVSNEWFLSVGVTSTCTTSATLPPCPDSVD